MLKVVLNEFPLGKSQKVFKMLYFNYNTNDYLVNLLWF